MRLESLVFSKLGFLRSLADLSRGTNHIWWRCRYCGDNSSLMLFPNEAKKNKRQAHHLISDSSSHWDYVSHFNGNVMGAYPLINLFAQKYGSFVFLIYEECDRESTSERGAHEGKTKKGPRRFVEKHHICRKTPEITKVIQNRALRMPFASVVESAWSRTYVLRPDAVPPRAHVSPRAEIVRFTLQHRRLEFK